MDELIWMRHAVAAVSLMLLLALESVAPEVVGALFSRRWRHAARNLGLGLCNGVLGVVLFAPVLAVVSGVAADRGMGLFYWVGGGIWATAALLIIFDLWMYVWHRLNHRIGWLWRWHRVHHTDVAMDVTTAVRFHPGEIALSTIARLALIPLLGLSATNLLIYELILLPVILYHHSNVRMPPALDNALRLLIVTPRMHRVHHSALRVETDSNYGSVLSIWDRLFGSHRRRDDQTNLQFGLDANRDDADQTVLGMLSTPVRRPRS